MELSALSANEEATSRRAMGGLPFSPGRFERITEEALGPKLLRMRVSTSLDTNGRAVS